MEHQRSNLNTLPRLLAYRLRIYKGGMRHPPRPPVKLRIKTLDQHDLLRRLAVDIIPSVLCVGTHSQRLAPSVGIDEPDRNKVSIGHRKRVSYREWVFVDCLDGSPDVYYLVACLEQVFGFVWEVVRHAVFGGGVRLVDMHAVDGTAEV